MDLLLCLNHDHFKVIISSWIQAVDVCRLDSAYCNHATRSIFLELLASKALIISNIFKGQYENDALTQSICKWITLRRVNVDALVLSELVESSTLRQIVSHSGSSLVEIDCARLLEKEDILMISKSCQNLTHISLSAVDAIHPAWSIVECPIKNLLVWGEAGPSSALYQPVGECWKTVNVLNISLSDNPSLGYLDTLLSACPNLTFLYLDSYIDFEPYEAFVHCCPRLEALYAKSVSTAGLVQIVSNCPKLKTLWLAEGDCDPEEEPSMNDVLEALGRRHCPDLTELGVPQPSIVLDPCLIQAVETCTKLVYLDLQCCELITDESIIAVGRSCSVLRSLNIKKCTALTDVGLQSISDGCLQLEFLDIKHLSLITAAGVSQLANKCVLLKILKMFRWKRFEGKCYENLAKNSASLEILGANLDARAKSIFDDTRPDVKIYRYQDFEPYID